jgi:hypothetical protein
MGPLGDMNEIIDDLMEPLNNPIDFMVESADIAIADRKKYPNCKPAEVVLENLKGDHKKSDSNRIEIEPEFEQKVE